MNEVLLATWCLAYDKQNNGDRPRTERREEINVRPESGGYPKGDAVVDPLEIFARESTGDELARESTIERIARESTGGGLARESTGDVSARESTSERIARESTSERIARESTDVSTVSTYLY